MTTSRRLCKPLVASAILAGSLVTAMPASAASSAIDLRYERADDIPGCLSEQELEDAIVERLPTDTTIERRTDAPVRITIRIVRGGDVGLRATIALEEEGRDDEAVQELVASAGECRTLGSAAALAASLAIERSIDRHREEAAHVAAPPPPAPDTRKRRLSRKPQKPSRPRPPTSTLGVTTHAAASLGYGLLPKPTPGVLAGGALELGAWRVGLEAGAYFPAEASSPQGGGANASLVFLAATPCRRVGRLEACAVTAIGDVRAAGTGALMSRVSHGVYAALGLRGGIELLRADPFSFVLHLGLVAPLLRTTLRIGDEVLWRAPAAAGEAGLTWRVTIL